MLFVYMLGIISPVFNFHLIADTKHYPVFVGHRPGRNNTQRHKLDIQLIVITNRTLYIAARSVCFLSTRVARRSFVLECRPQDFKSASFSRDLPGFCHSQKSTPSQAFCGSSISINVAYIYGITRMDHSYGLLLKHKVHKKDTNYNFMSF